MVFRLDSFNLVENAFATRQLVLLATSIAFYDFWLERAQKSKLKFSISDIFFRFSFFSFSFLFAAVIDLLLGLLVPRDFFYGLNRGERFFSRKCDLKMKLESKTDCICVIYSLFSYFFSSVTHVKLISLFLFVLQHENYVKINKLPSKI